MLHVMNGVSSESVVAPEFRPVDELADPSPARLEGLIAANRQSVLPDAVQLHDLALGKLLQNPLLDVLFHFGGRTLPAAPALPRHALGRPTLDVLARNVQLAADLSDGQFLLEQQPHCPLFLLLRIALVGPALVAALAHRLPGRLLLQRVLALLTLPLLQFHLSTVVPVARICHFNGRGHARGRNHWQGR